MSQCTPTENATPVLYLRPRAPTELVRPRQKIKQPDGPWIAHPGLIDEEFSTNLNVGRSGTVEELKHMRETGSLQISAVIDMARLVDMSRMQGMPDHAIASAIEKHYVNAHQYVSLI
jgi:hypothetical protein